MPRRRPLPIADGSFLRRADPRTKFVLCLAASAAVTLPLRPLALFVAAYVVLIIAARLGRHALAAVRRIVLLLAGLAALDWWWIGPEFALLITLRLALLVTAYTLLVATTTPDEVRRALERLRVPRRVAFTFATAFASLGLLEAEWHAIIEAQHARGIVSDGTAGGWRAWRTRLAHIVSLVVPAIVALTQRAWALTEAAAARGIEAPHRHARDGLRLGPLDHALLAGMAGVLVVLFASR